MNSKLLISTVLISSIIAAPAMAGKTPGGPIVDKRDNLKSIIQSNVTNVTNDIRQTGIENKAYITQNTATDIINTVRQQGTGDSLVITQQNALDVVNEISQGSPFSVSKGNSASVTQNNVVFSDVDINQSGQSSYLQVSQINTNGGYTQLHQGGLNGSKGVNNDMEVYQSNSPVYTNAAQQGDYNSLSLSSVNTRGNGIMVSQMGNNNSASFVQGAGTTSVEAPINMEGGSSGSGISQGGSYNIASANIANPIDAKIEQWDTTYSQATVYARGRDSSIFVTQQGGSEHNAAITSNGTMNSMFVSQITTGTPQKATLQVTGHGNSITHAQKDNKQTSELTLIGSNNNVHGEQSGSNNTEVTRITGSNNTVNVTQSNGTGLGGNIATANIQLSNVNLNMGQAGTGNSFILSAK